jgi:hypothetical protein
VTEFLSGFLVGVIIAIALHVKRPRRSGAAASLDLWERAGLRQSRSELEAENRALRDGLRYTRNVMRNTGVMPSVARYIDRLLSDEAGA